ncbi:MAG: hypothetical protein K6U74_08435 [Firmicutes bacterium]|nr:hypothetical protein [Bacillota bacterium]
MCQTTQCPFEGYEGECTLTSAETKALLDKFDRDPCPDFSDEKEEREYWNWVEQAQDFLEELRIQQEEKVNDLLARALRGEP